jgi:2-polyprenyl-3-methyl-5-hydroxy-6-metoxy-1,4-benzoquinol methylase
MDAQAWDERYRASELLWTAEPNRFLVEHAGDLPVGRALDIAAGEGRNAVWLAREGWEVTAVDFSPVGLAKGRQLAEAHAVAVEWVQADVTTWEPEPAAYDLVIVLYLQLPAAQRTTVYQRAAAAVAPGGRLLVVGHDRSNLEHGVGGPQHPAVLFTDDDVVADLSGSGLEVETAAQVERPVPTDEGERTAIDCLVRAHRPEA